MDLGAQLPHGALRVFVMGERAAKLEEATAEEVSQMRALTAEALSKLDPARAHGDRSDGASVVAHWAQAHAEPLARAKAFLDALERSGDLSIAKLTLANSQIRELASR